MAFFGKCMDTISKQKKYLSENLVVESLRMFELNKEEVKEFFQAKSGNKIAEYLKNDAWNEDQENNTRVFLVRDRKTRKITYYYAINCGILYKEISTIDMSYDEQVYVEKLIKAIRQNERSELSSQERDAVYKLLEEAYESFDNIKDSDRASLLITYAHEQAEKKEEINQNKLQGGDDGCVKNVEQTYPAIDIKFLCRNSEYKPDIEIDFKFGVYVFWEIIVPHILKISELVGCKYVYLFAADNTLVDNNLKAKDNSIIYSKGYDVDSEGTMDNEMETDENVKKLVSYYINNLKFRPASAEYTILKPKYERTCYTLVQNVDELSWKRELIWSSHDLDNEIETYTE